MRLGLHWVGSHDLSHSDAFFWGRWPCVVNERHGDSPSSMFTWSQLYSIVTDKHHWWRAKRQLGFPLTRRDRTIGLSCRWIFASSFQNHSGDDQDSGSQQRPDHNRRAKDEFGGFFRMWNHAISSFPFVLSMIGCIGSSSDCCSVSEWRSCRQASSQLPFKSR